MKAVKILANKIDNTTEWEVRAVGNLKEVHEVATQTSAGLMSAGDKVKLDGVAVGANKYVHPTNAGNKHVPAGGASGQILRWGSDGTAVWGADKDTGSTNFVITAPTQAARNVRGDGASAGYDSTMGGGNLAHYWYNNALAINAGTYTLQSLLQQLVNNSHRHYVVRENYNCVCDCNCDCGDSDSGCIISGNILTKWGYKPIEQLCVGDCIMYNGNTYPVIGIAKNVLGKRKAVSPKSSNLVVTDEHLFFLGNDVGAYNVERYLATKDEFLTDGDVRGTYARKDAVNVVTLDSGLVERNEYTQDAVTYTLIVDGCEWCVADGFIIACARAIK